MPQGKKNQHNDGVNSKKFHHRAPKYLVAKSGGKLFFSFWHFVDPTKRNNYCKVWIRLFCVIDRYTYCRQNSSKNDRHKYLGEIIHWFLVNIYIIRSKSIPLCIRKTQLVKKKIRSNNQDRSQPFQQFNNHRRTACLNAIYNVTFKTTSFNMYILGALNKINYMDIPKGVLRD